LVIWPLDLSDLAIWVDDKHFTDRDAHGLIAHSVGLSVAKAAVEWRLLRREQLHDVFETSDLEDLGLPQNDFTVERVKQAVRAHYQRAWWKSLLVSVLPQVVDVIPARVGLSNCARRQVKHLVAVCADLLK